MRAITFIYAYYENPGMLAEQYRIWSSYPEELKQKVSVIIVDDGSPLYPAVNVEMPEGLPLINIYRVAVDIPWHQDGARNLGAKEAKDGWLFLSDMDHAMPATSLEFLMKQDGMNTFYTFPRVDAPHMKPNAKGPGLNIYAMTKRTYWERMKGYDEDMCGQYGSDGAPRRRLEKTCIHMNLRFCPVIRYPREVIADASTTAWERRGKANEEARKQRLERKAQLGRQGKITTLDFEWARVF